MRSQAVDPAAGNALFAAKRADAISGTKTQLLLNPIPAGSQPPRIFAYADYDIDPLGFVVPRQLPPDARAAGLMKKFVAGYVKAWNWACANPRQAVTLARANYSTTISPRPGHRALEARLQLQADEGRGDGEARPTGYMMLADWAPTVKILRSNPDLFGSQRNVPPAATLFTNTYVNQAFPAPCAKNQKSTAKKPCKAGGYS